MTTQVASERVSPEVRRTGQSSRSLRGERRTMLLAAPALAFLALLFIYPLIKMLKVSVGLPDELTLGVYGSVLTNSAYHQVFLVTVQISVAVAVISLVLGYPVAFYLTVASPVVSRLVMAMFLVPFLTSILVRMFGWVVLLSPGGILPAIFRAIGLGEVELLYNRPGVVVGMVYALLPYTVFTLYAVMYGVDGSLVPAARSLGASEWQAFREAYLPQTMPGVVASFILTFVLALGYFFTPRLMGGPEDQTIASVIQNQVDLALNETEAAAMGVLLLLVVGLGVILAGKLIGFSKLFEGRVP